MSGFQCEVCGAFENTALGDYWGRSVKRCSECATGRWHNVFPKMYLPLGEFVVGPNNRLRHKNGDTDLSKYLSEVPYAKQNTQSN